MLQTITYTGPFAEVEFETLSGAWVTCAHGATVEVADALAVSMLEQPDNWQTAAGTPAPTGEDN